MEEDKVIDLLFTSMFCDHLRNSECHVNNTVGQNTVVIDA